MAENTEIGWCTHTGNLWWGCVEVHEGCDNCYAAKLSHRYGFDLWGAKKYRKASKSFFKDIARFNRLAAKAGEVHTVFVGSMMDIFEKPMQMVNSKLEVTPFMSSDPRRIFFEEITKGLYPNLVFLLLTKRPSNINKYIPIEWKQNPPKNVWFGTSIVNQPTANKLIQELQQVNGNLFLSIEPQLNAINLEGLADGIGWIIQGGESGPGRRPFDIKWAYDMKEFCKKKEIPYFFKQVDKVIKPPIDLEESKQFPQW